MSRATSRLSAAAGYQLAGQALDEHMNSCPACRSGRGCPDGDDSAEEEFHAYRAWSREDPTAARSARTHGLS
jgi:hypothetical protein